MNSSSRGATIIEVVVALAIVSLVMISLWEGYNLAALAHRRSALYEMAAVEADRLMASDPLAVDDGGTFTQNTAAGALTCRWQIAPAETEALYAMTLVMTDEATEETWTFFTLKKAAADE